MRRVHDEASELQRGLATLRQIHAASHAVQRALTPRLATRRGWAIYDNGPDHHPITGRFRAWRHGVAIGSGTLTGLIGIIDTRPTW